MRTVRAQPSDWKALRQLYRRNHPSASSDLKRRRWQTQTFVTLDDGNGNRLLGFAIASYAGQRSRRYGVIRALEIESNLRFGELLQPLLARGLVSVCTTWLEAQWCSWASVPALADPRYAWLRQEIQAEPGPVGFTIRLDPRSPEWQWVLDPQTGVLYPEAGPEGMPPGPPPRPFQVPRQVWN